nr:hypothetical protein [Tanacetum cinerariifolium]
IIVVASVNVDVGDDVD